MSQGCANSGPGLTGMEAQVVGLIDSEKRNRLVMCESIPFTWDAVNSLTLSFSTVYQEARYSRASQIWWVRWKG